METSVEKIIEDVNLGMKNNMENLLSPIVEKLKVSRERDMVILNVLKQMPEYINLIEENKKLKNLLSKNSNNGIKMDIIEKCNIGKTYSSDDLKESFQINNQFKNIKKDIEEKEAEFKEKYIHLEEKLLKWDAKLASFIEMVSISNPLYNEIYKLKADYNKIFNESENKIYEQENNMWREIPEIESWEYKLRNNLVSNSEDSEDSEDSDDSKDNEDNKETEDEECLAVVKIDSVDDRLLRETAEAESTKTMNYIDCKEDEEDDKEDESDKEEDEDTNKDVEEDEDTNEQENKEEDDEELSSDEENINKDLLNASDSEDEEEEFFPVDICNPEGIQNEYFTTNEQTGYIYDILDDDEIGEKVGKFEFGKAVFFN